MADHPTELTFQRFVAGDALDERQRAELKVHLAGCVDCRRVVQYDEALRAAVRDATAVADVAPARAVPPDRVIARLRQGAGPGVSPEMIRSAEADFLANLNWIERTVAADREQLEALFLDNLNWIERTVAAVCRRHGFNADDVPDVTSWVKLRLVEDDYAVFRKFRGESAVTTYLAVVVGMLVREYRVQCWRRWRPSAAARRRGPLAVRLEALVRRDGLSLDAAAQVLRTSGEADLSDRQLAALLSDLPPRAPRRVDPRQDALTGALPAARADELEADLDVVDEASEGRLAADRALAAALERLAFEDRLILRMRFQDGWTVPEIAQALGQPATPLYRRIERALAQLRAHLESGGLSRDDTRTRLSRWMP